jgi:hypothetical protein
MRPRLLFLSPDLPFPPHQGAAIRTFNFIKNLASRHEIHLLSFARGDDVPARVAALSRYCSSVTTVPAPDRSPVRRALSVLFSTLPDMALRLPSPEFENQLRIILERDRFELVQVEAIEMAQYGWLVKRSETRPRPRVLFDDINAEYLLQKRAFEADVRRPHRWLPALYSLIQWRKLRRYEAEACKQTPRPSAVWCPNCSVLWSLTE